MSGVPPIQIVKGYHGTDQTNSKSIQAENFRVGTDDQWLGRGAYFFVEGVSCEAPPADAKNWALFWCRGRYLKWSVLSAEISTERLLDLTDRENLKIFNQLRQVTRRRFGPRVPKAYQRGSGIDTLVLEQLFKAGKITAAKGDFYTKFNKDTAEIPSRLPNVTILCVFDPADAIDLKSIKEHSTGLIL